VEKIGGERDAPGGLREQGRPESKQRGELHQRVGKVTTVKKIQFAMPHVSNQQSGRITIEKKGPRGPTRRKQRKSRRRKDFLNGTHATHMRGPKILDGGAAKLVSPIKVKIQSSEGCGSTRKGAHELNVGMGREKKVHGEEQLQSS